MNWLFIIRCSDAPVYVDRVVLSAQVLQCMCVLSQCPVKAVDRYVIYITKYLCSTNRVCKRLIYLEPFSMPNINIGLLFTPLSQLVFAFKLKIYLNIKFHAFDIGCSGNWDHQSVKQLQKGITSQNLRSRNKPRKLIS